MTVKDQQDNNVAGCSFTYRPDVGATVAIVPVNLISGALILTHSIAGATNGVNGFGLSNSVNGSH